MPLSGANSFASGMRRALPHSKMKPPTVLTIAGSDPSGGAGIQADLRAFSALGVTGISAITAITVQTSQGVLAVHLVPADVLFDQAEALFEDSDIQAVKIGMLGGVEQVLAVAELLRRFRPPDVVLDPVLASTGGVPLLDEAGMGLLKRELLPFVDLVTPNLAEAGALTGRPVESSASMRVAGEELLWLGSRNVLVKGGHLPGEPIDVLFLNDGRVIEFEGERIPVGRASLPANRLAGGDARPTIETHASSGLHGTGCLLSSAIAASLALGTDLTRAARDAKALLNAAMLRPRVFGRGRGYPDVLAAVRAGSGRTHAERLALLSGVYVLTDPNLRPDRSAEEIVGAALEGGAKVVQLRDKQLSSPDLIELAKRLAATAKNAGALFLVNDRVDVAMASEADGVHLGPDDMHPADARRILGPDALIGVSVSTVEEAMPLAQYASYLGVGAVFGSTTKGDAGPPVGLERIREIKRAFPAHPIVAIGGIYSGNIRQVAEAGVDAAAVVSAVVGAEDMAEATRELLVRFTKT